MPENLENTELELVGNEAQDQAAITALVPTAMNPYVMSYAAQMALAEGFVTDGPAGF